MVMSALCANGRENKEQKRRKMAEKHNSDYYIKWILINRLLNTVRQAKGLPLVECPYKQERKATSEAQTSKEERKATGEAQASKEKKEEEE